MIARDGHGPVAFALSELFQEAGGVIDVLVRLQHLVERGELLGVEIMVDLHTAHVDQLGAGSLCGRELAQRLLLVGAVDRAAFHIQRIRLERALSPRPR